MPLYIYVTQRPLEPAPHLADGQAVKIPTAHGPALRSAVQEIRNEIGERLAGAHSYDKEEALTRAASALGALAGVINQAIKEEDPDYA